MLGVRKRDQLMHSLALFVTNSCANEMMSKDSFEWRRKRAKILATACHEQDCYSRRIWLGFKCG